jgi:protein SCO1
MIGHSIPQASRRCLAALLFILQLSLFLIPSFASSQNHHVTGMLLSSDRSQRTITVSCKEIPGFMDAMVMSFPVQDAQLAPDLRPGMNVEFDLIVNKGSSFAQNLRIRPFESLELDPTEARRLKLVENASSAKPPSADALHFGDAVPDFHLIDQNHANVSLAQFRGKLVALTFIYTRCPRPDYCLRLSNNFGVLERRFKRDLGNDLILLTVVIDPIHDRADALQTYAHTWKADSKRWHFLTGPTAEVQQLCRRFDMAYYPDEALFVHSFHTVLIDRDGRLAANLEGNDFTAQQLGDLVATFAKK